MAVGVAERGRDRYAPTIGQKRPLEPKLAPVNRAFAGSLAAAREPCEPTLCLLAQSVEAGCGHILGRSEPS